ncbi:hypothetical protein TIFTF001_040362 [Ficus carica]|uniref:Uncharacterized protein n=1 Tax=Ficus carica TaxID=3494 RepID=A0AA87Z2M2_FICCA|nr:hypothetical protein TIFTF001_040360 [Ficus carica]GMN22890.1 hypothetical protein TIFTF001_040362 [Ficus carica]
MCNRNSSANIVKNGNINMNNHGSGPHHEDDNHGSENAQRDVDAMLAMAMVATTIARRNRRRDPVPMHNSSLTGRIRVEEILNGHLEIIQGMISIKADTFRALSATIRQISYLFQHPKETTSRWFYTVLLAICALKDEFIRPLNYTAVQPLIMEHRFDGTGPSTGPQQHDSRRDAMNQLRDMMADDMWDIYQSSPWYKTT